MAPGKHIEAACSEPACEGHGEPAASAGPVSVAGHFGEWLQGRNGPAGPVVLVTLPCTRLVARAPARGTPPFPPALLARFAELLGLTHLPDGVETTMRPGAGAGASTASLVALARAAGYDGAPERLASACRAIEGATDPLMFPHPDRLLWASREARALTPLPAPPACEILGGFWGPPERTDPRDSDFDRVDDLVRDWLRATQAGCRDDVARVATASAERCDARRGRAGPLADLARDLGALGRVRAHTGSARGLVFAPGTVPPGAADALAEAGLTRVLRFSTGGS